MVNWTLLRSVSFGFVWFRQVSFGIGRFRGKGTPVRYGRLKRKLQSPSSSRPQVQVQVSRFSTSYTTPQRQNHDITYVKNGAKLYSQGHSKDVIVNYNININNCKRLLCLFTIYNIIILCSVHTVKLMTHSPVFGAENRHRK